MYKTENPNDSIDESLTRNIYTDNPVIQLQESVEPKSPRLHWSSIILATQLVTTDPPNIFHHTYEAICRDVPSSVWQRHIQTAYRQRYISKHTIKKETFTPRKTTQQNIPTLFRPLPRNYMIPSHNLSNQNINGSVAGMTTFRIKKKLSSSSFLTKELSKLKTMI